MNGGIDPEPHEICDWCGVRYELWDKRARDGFCPKCIKLGCQRLAYSTRKENLTWFGRFFRRLIFKDES